MLLNRELSPVALGILAGLEEALEDAKGNVVPGIKKTTIYETVSTETTASFPNSLSSIGLHTAF